MRKPVYKKVLITGLTILPPKVVRLILHSSDTTVFIVSLMASVSVFYGVDSSAWPTSLAKVLLSAIGLWMLLLPAFRLHRIKLVILNASDLLRLVLASVVAALLMLAVGAVFSLPKFLEMSLSVWAFSFAGMTASRALAVSILGDLRERLRKRTKVAVFGASAAGVQMALTMSQAIDIRIVAFFDDNRALQGVEVGGVPVWSPKSLVADMYRHDIKRLIVALPESAAKRQRMIIDQCKQAGIEVQVLPTVIDLLAERDGDRPRVVGANDILERSKVDLDVPEVTQSYAGRVIMVTGAGGSIGSELCRQLLPCRPSKIILYESSEFNLYTIDMDLAPRARAAGVAVVSCLGSITDPERLREIMQREGVEIVLHAAAYKHVPLVEDNPIAGVANNVFGTKTLADAAIEAGVERFILVSSDKAVRPTSVMGATKRIAELILQDLQTRTTTTLFSMVRFGNVLGSSGSVFPLFKAQIEAGGPVTVTHPEVRRYFMTVQEAARLVLLAGTYAEGGDVFVLDMGQAQNILNVARKMIRMSGRQEKDPNTGQGDIEIVFTGLRPGEKLYEELFVDRKNMRKTPHARILRAEEQRLSQFEVAGLLRELQVAMEGGDVDKVRSLAFSRIDQTARVPERYQA